MKPQRIAIIGAGPMGLAVAYQLVLDGHRPVVFEADDRVGGMTAAMDFGGIRIERYYHFHCVSDHGFLGILAELGISDRMRWVETKMGYWYQQRLQPWGTPIALLKFGGLGWVSKFRYALHAWLSIRRSNWRPLDSMKATQWVRRWVGQQAYDVLWRKLFELKFYDYAENVSAAWIWSRIRRIGRSRYDLFREKLGYLDGGSDTLLQALKTAIESGGGEIRLSTPVQRVTIDAGRVTGIALSTGQEPFDKVISTAPLPYVSRLIPDLPENILEQYRSLKNIAVVCVIARLRKSVTSNFWLNTNDPEMDIPVLVEYSNLRPLKDHVVYVPFYLPGEHPKFAHSDDVFLEKVRRYLKKINPSLVDEDFLEMRASRYRHAQPVCETNHLHRLPPVELPVVGLWVADTSYYYPEDRGISESIDFGRGMAKAAAAF
jgi:protoporphyrinogen oxidase